MKKDSVLRRVFFYVQWTLDFEKVLCLQNFYREFSNGDFYSVHCFLDDLSGFIDIFIVVSVSKFIGKCCSFHSKA